MRFYRENRLLILMLGATILMILGSAAYAARDDASSGCATLEESTKPMESEIIETIVETVESTTLHPEPSEPEIIMYYSEDEVVMLAKILWTECRGVPSTTRKACVAWTVCNRADIDEYGSIFAAITAPAQFAWYPSAPVLDELYWIAEDVLTRWNLEKNGETDVGRVLPQGYMWFHGENGENYFRNKYDGNFETWDYSLQSSYED